LPATLLVAKTPVKILSLPKDFEASFAGIKKRSCKERARLLKNVSQFLEGIFGCFGEESEAVSVALNC